MTIRDVLHQEEIPGGKHWSFTVGRGTLLRLVDLEGGANVGMLFYNPANLLERYNAPDTLKGQHTFRLTAGHCLYSDMGRIFCSIVEDSAGFVAARQLSVPHGQVVAHGRMISGANLAWANSPAADRFTLARGVAGQGGGS